MFDASILSKDRNVNYRHLEETLPHFISEHETWITTLSNMSALLNVFIDDINWVGFYIYQQGKLILGPFQGAPACTEIALGTGVCGEAAEQEKPVIVEDVLARKNHIACDVRSRSEIVIPMIKDGKLLGVLDLDSPKRARFDTRDQDLLEKVVRVIVDNWR